MASQEAVGLICIVGLWRPFKGCSDLFSMRNCVNSSLCVSINMIRMHFRSRGVSFGFVGIATYDVVVVMEGVC